MTGLWKVVCSIAVKPSLYKWLPDIPKGISLTPEEHHVKKQNDIDHVTQPERPGWQSKASVLLGTSTRACQKLATKWVGTGRLLASISSPQPLCGSDVHAHSCLPLSSLQHVWPQDLHWQAVPADQVFWILLVSLDQIWEYKQNK